MNENINEYPLLPLRGMMVFPGMVVNLDVGRELSVNAVELAYAGSRRLALVTQKDAAKADIGRSDLYDYGVLAEVRQLIRLPNGAVRILIEGLCRLSYQDIRERLEPRRCFGCLAQRLDSYVSDETEAEVLRRLVLDVFEEWAGATQKLSADLVQSMKNHLDPCKVADLTAGYLNISIEEKEGLLEQADVNARLRSLYELLKRERELGALAKSIAKEVHEAIEKNQREFYLREQLKVINKELGDGEDLVSEVAEYRERLQKLQLPEELRRKLEKELSRLAKMPPLNMENGVIRNYLDAVLELPWGSFTEDSYDLERAAKVLDRDHYGLKKVKERILEFLAVRSLTRGQDGKGTILCLAGPPGVGKTSLARSVAEAMGRRFVRVSLGGIRDEAEIRGHRRTYVASMPGRIIRGMQDCGCMNPVFLLDEVDKLAADFRGDPAAALLEALDPEQNSSFSDHFIEYPFDLSHVFWIVTANTTETIPPALLDRMDVISLSSYTEEEKTQIARLHLLPKLRREHGLEKYRLVVSGKALRRVIRDYTREAGVRGLERKLAAVCRKTAQKIVAGEAKGAVVNEKNLEKYLGPVIFLEDDLRAESAVGVCTGLAWTSVGGEVLKVEVLSFKGKGALALTGRLGEVMQESARAGFAYIRSRAGELGLEDDFYERTDLHIHLPEGAVPKDGPSAGVTMVTAMVSALTGSRVRAGLAMTGEITLSGRVLPVGGIKEKMLAAHRYGVKTVLLPRRNMQDLEELPESVRSAMEFVPVAHMDEVLKLALEV